MSFRDPKLATDKKIGGYRDGATKLESADRAQWGAGGGGDMRASTGHLLWGRGRVFFSEVADSRGGAQVIWPVGRALTVAAGRGLLDCRKGPPIPTRARGLADADIDVPLPCWQGVLSHRAVLCAAGGIAGQRRVYLLRGAGVVVFIQRSGGVRELSRHAGPVRFLAEIQPPRLHDLQRLPRAARLGGQVDHEGGERVPAFLGFHVSGFPRADPAARFQPMGVAGELSALPRRVCFPGRSAWGRFGQRSDELCALPCGCGPRRACRLRADHERRSC